MALSWSIDVSVISRTISDGSTPASPMIASTSSTKSGWTSCLAEMLTLTVNPGVTRSRQASDLTTGLAQHPAADLEDRVGLLGHPDEVVRADPAALGVLPAHEGLDADHPARRDLDDGLVLQDELAGGDRVLEVGRQLGAGHHRLVHRGFEDDHPALATSLRRIHRDVGVAQQVAGALDAGPARGHADAGADVHVAALDLEERAHRRGQPVGHAHRRLHVRRVAQEDGELVAAEPGGHVAGAQHRPEAIADGHQQRIAGSVTEAVVDELEVVQVDEQDDRHGPARIAGFEARGDDLGEQRPIGEPGQRVVQRLVVQLLLEPPELLERLLQPAVLEGDRRVVGERLEELEVLGLERADVAQGVGHEERADERRLAGQRRDQRLAAVPAGRRRPLLRPAAGRRAGPGAR